MQTISSCDWRNRQYPTGRFQCFTRGWKSASVGTESSTTRSSAASLSGCSRALRFRTTSVSTDEPLCLSTLAGVELKKVLEEKKQDPMRRFWELIPKLSTALLYWNGPRLNVPGLRWAPASLLGASQEAFLAHSAKQTTEAKEAIRTPSGLVLTSPGILLGGWTISVRKSFWLRCGEDFWYYVDLASDVGPPRPLSGDTEVVSQLRGWEGRSSPPQVLALLTHASPQEYFNHLSFQVAERPTSCALVSIYGTQPDLLFASFESAGVIRYLNLIKHRYPCRSPSPRWPALSSMSCARRWQQ